MNNFNKKINEHIGKRIFQRRSELNITLESLSHLSCITLAELTHIEEGKMPISAAKLFDLAHLLNVQIGYFFES